MRAKLMIAGLMAALCLATGAEAKKKQLEISIQKDDIDLANRTITFRLNRPCDSVELTVFDVQGEEIASRVEVFDGAPAGEPLSIGWPELPAGTDKFRIDLKVTDVDEFWVGASICRFHGEIPHQEVVFESGKWEIRPEEADRKSTRLNSSHYS
mgnify:FL=1